MKRLGALVFRKWDKNIRAVSGSKNDLIAQENLQIH